MPLLAPHQLAVAGFELLLLLVGAGWLVRMLAVRQARSAAFGPNSLPLWPLGGFEVALLLVTLFLCGLVGQGVAGQVFGPAVRAAGDRAGLEVVLFGAGFHGAALLGWPLFTALRRALFAHYGAPAPAAPHPVPLAAGRAWRLGAAALVLSLPLITAGSLGWTAVLRALGLPDEPQDLIAIFKSVESPAVLVGMLVVACVVAPLNEELIFRGTIFRYCRQRFGRGIAVVTSAALFGALHGNWAGFLPLALLGAGLALAYERTGDIRVPIVAHALFNLNTILILFADLPQA